MSVLVFRQPDPYALLLNYHRFVPRENADGLDMICLECDEVLQFGKASTVEGIKADLRLHKCGKEEVQQ